MPVRVAAFMAALASLSACNAFAQQAPPATLDAPQTVAISSARRGNQVNRLAYEGRWEFVRNRRDGRYQGGSARSHHVGDSVSIVFDGDHLRIYGVTGRNGGRGVLLIAGKKYRDVSFRSSSKQTHKLIYDSGPLGPGVHSAGLVVAPIGNGKTAGYVNLDEIEVGTHGARLSPIANR
ncbi:MAG: hypothetical protein M3R51_10710 [Candidatus Eremiobacteraeota bacterium]|nr:hypothetical protein [Candidatus Eremiobacteraeota bacterium]